MMSRRRAPRARRTPISRVRSLTEGQHDVHDPDAADQQRDRGDRAQHDGEDPLRLARLLQQQLRHDDLVVLLLVGKRLSVCSTTLAVGTTASRSLIARISSLSSTRSAIMLPLLGGG